MEKMSTVLVTILKKREIVRKAFLTTFMHYDSRMNILVTGDGDFGFSKCLATNLNPATRIIATSIDSVDLLFNKYPLAEKNVKEIRALGARVYHNVNVRTMNLHPILFLKKFDAIIFNFPHAGFKWREDDNRMIMKHGGLVGAFMANARELLKADGEIHITHKIGGPYVKWGIEKIAANYGLKLKQKVNFLGQNYPGYDRSLELENSPETLSL